MAFAKLLEQQPEEDEFEPVRPALRLSQPTSRSSPLSSGKKSETAKSRKAGKPAGMMGIGVTSVKMMSQELTDGQWTPENKNCGNYKRKKSPQAQTSLKSSRTYKENEDGAGSKNPWQDDKDDGTGDLDHNSHTPWQSVKRVGIKRALEYNSKSPQDKIGSNRKLKSPTTPVVNDNEGEDQEGTISSSDAEYGSESSEEIISPKKRFKRIPVVSDDEEDDDLDGLPTKSDPKSDICDLEDQEGTFSSSDETDEEEEDADFELEGDDEIKNINQEAENNYCLASTSTGKKTVISDYWKNLMNHLKELSCLKQGQDLKTLTGQWYLRFVEDLGRGDFDECPCGKVGIQYLFHIKNIVTEKETYIGSKCIMHFRPYDKTTVKLVVKVLRDGITGTLINKKSLKFQVSGRCCLVNARDRLKESGFLPLKMPREAGAPSPILTVKASDKVRSKVDQMEEGSSYCIKLQLFLRKVKRDRDHWNVEMVGFAPIQRRERAHVPRDVRQFMQ